MPIPTHDEPTHPATGHDDLHEHPADRASYPRNAADPAGDPAGEGGHAKGGFDTESLRDEANRQYEKVKAEAGQYFTGATEQAREQFSHLQGGLEDVVRERPVQSLLVAAGIGLVVGTLLKR